MALALSRKFNMIDDINPRREIWRIQVRVVRLYKVPIYNNPDMIWSPDMMLMDEKSSRIHAKVKTTLI
ncbi:hypothetical protein vseg_007821 [Gypsophila vaccaria]